MNQGAGSPGVKRTVVMRADDSTFRLRGAGRRFRADFPSTGESATRDKTKLRIGQHARPDFFESEEQPHVKEVNEARRPPGEQVGGFGASGEGEAVEKF